MPAERSPGYDHPHLAFSALPDRPRLVLELPGVGATAVAVTPLILLELFEDPLPAWPQLRSVAGGLERAFPNISRVSTREYGHRVGIFRMVDLLVDRGIRPVVAVDAMTAEHYPFLVDWLGERGVTWVAHGIALTRPIGNHMTESDEAAYVAETMAHLSVCGVTTSGWLGPEYGESERTPAILARAGLRYVADWCCDEQPVPMTVPVGSLTAFPLNADLDDQTTLANRMLEPAAYRRHLLDALAQLTEDGRDSARVLSFCMRPWLTGQPFRVGVFEDFLDAVLDTPGATFASPDVILDATRPLPEEVAP